MVNLQYNKMEIISLHKNSGVLNVENIRKQKNNIFMENGLLDKRKFLIDIMVTYILNPKIFLKYLQYIS